MLQNEVTAEAWTNENLAERLSERVAGLDIEPTFDTETGRILLNLRLHEDVPEYLFWLLRFELRTTDVSITFDVEGVQYEPGTRPRARLALEPAIEMAVDTSLSQASQSENRHRLAISTLTGQAELFRRFMGRPDYDWRSEIYEIEFGHVDHADRVLYGHAGFAPAQVQTLAQSARLIESARTVDEAAFRKAEQAAKELLDLEADAAFSEHMPEEFYASYDAAAADVPEPVSLVAYFRNTLDDEFELGLFDAATPVQEFSMDDGNVELPDGVIELRQVRQTSDSGPVLIHDTPIRHVDDNWL